MIDGDPFRSAPVVPAGLSELAAGAASRRRELPREAARVASLGRRVERALDIHNAPGIPSLVAICVAMVFIVLGATGGSTLAVIVGVLLILTGIGIDGALVRAARADTAKLLRAGERQPFPVQGYALWLASERPLFDVHLRRAVDQTVVGDAIAAVDPDIAIDWLDDHTLRVVIPTRALGTADEPMNLGDRAAWRRFAETILATLHAEVGIERVEMGGSMRVLRP